MQNKTLLFLAALFMLVAVSCNKAGKTGLLVPKDAGIVVYVNTASLNKKLSWDEIKQTSWFKEAAAESKDSFATKLMNDPSASGVDMEGGLVFFFKKQGRGGYASFQGKLKDAAKFEAMLKQAKNTTATAQKSGDFSYLQLDNDAIVTWTSSRFVFIGGANMPNPMNPMDRGGSMDREKFPVDSLIVFAKNTYTLKGDDLLDSDSKFASLIKSDGDMHFWMSSEKLYDGLYGGMMSMMKLNTLLQGNISTATLNFDNGKITVDGKQYYGKELAKVLDKYPAKEPGKDVVSRLPSGDVILAGVYSMSMESLVEIVRLIGADGLANMALGQKGLSLSDIAKAFKGQMAFAVTDFTVTQHTDTLFNEGKPAPYTTQKSEPNYVFGLALGDAAAFEKLNSAFMSEFGKDKPSNIIIKNDKSWLVVSNTDAAISSFQAGNNKPAYADKISGHGFGFYVNLQKLITSYKASETRDSVAMAIMDLSSATWQDGTAYADYKSGTTSYKMEINMVDKNTNSLKQLNKYADQVHQLRPKRHTIEEIHVDSLMPPAVDILPAPVK